MGYYYGNSSSLDDWRTYRRQQKYFETTYDRNSPYEQMKRERSRINILIPGLDNWDVDPNPKSCKWCHEVLITVDDGLNLFCQGCGLRTPTTTTSTSTNESKDRPTLPKESKSKLKQKDTLENKSFVITQSDDQRKDRKRRSVEDTETDEDLGALNYFSKLYGNSGDY